ncbi:MAG: hypothetical protein U0228_20110 [Myxococcaceae bacterium]
MGRVLRAVGGLLLVAGCHHAPPTPTPTAPTAAERRQQDFASWVTRVEAIPQCFAPEWGDAQPLDATEVVGGETVHVKGKLAVIELDCREFIDDLLLLRPGPTSWRQLNPHERWSLAEIEALVSDGEERGCGVVLGVRAGAKELAIEDPFDPWRPWALGDARVLDDTLGGVEAIVFGVVEVGNGKHGIVRVDRVCRAPLPPLELYVPPDSTERWPLLTALRHLADEPRVPRFRRRGALRAEFELVRGDPVAARRVAERLEREFGDATARTKLEAR